MEMRKEIKLYAPNLSQVNKLKQLISDLDVNDENYYIEKNKLEKSISDIYDYDKKAKVCNVEEPKYKSFYGLKFEVIQIGFLYFIRIKEGCWIEFYISHVPNEFRLKISINNGERYFFHKSKKIENAFFNFFTLCPNLNVIEFDNLRRIFFENFGKETENTAYAATFGEPLNFDDFDKNLPDIERLKDLPFDICPPALPFK